MAYKKRTTWRTLGGKAKELAKVCRLVNCRYTCGISYDQGHARLGFGGTPTQAAAAYPEGLCEAYAKFARRVRSEATPLHEAMEAVTLASDGVVHKHVARGPSTESSRELRRKEDEAATAGMRNPSSVLQRWPALVDCMSPIRDVLASWRSAHAALRGLTTCCGEVGAPPLGEDLL